MAEVKAGMTAFGEQINRAKTQLLALLRELPTHWEL